jgi:hypothetical protein
VLNLIIHQRGLLARHVIACSQEHTGVGGLDLNRHLELEFIPRAPRCRRASRCGAWAVSDRRREVYAEQERKVVVEDGGERHLFVLLIVEVARDLCVGQRG